MPLVRVSNGGSLDVPFAIYVGAASTNSTIGLFESDGTSVVAVNGSTKSNSQFTAYCSSSNGYIRALSAGTYRILGLYVGGSPSFTTKTVNANENIWSYSSRDNRCIVVYKID